MRMEFSGTTIASSFARSTSARLVTFLAGTIGHPAAKTTVAGIPCAKALDESSVAYHPLVKRLFSQRAYADIFDLSPWRGNRGARNRCRYPSEIVESICA